MVTKKTNLSRTAARVKPLSTRKKSVTSGKPVAPKKPVARIVTKPAAKLEIKKPKKEKVIRDSFTMPKSEYQKISDIKTVCLASGLSVKKSEVLRAGLKVLGKLNAAQLKLALSGIERVKTGRPNKR